MYSKHSVTAKRLITTLKKQIHKFMNSISKNIYIETLSLLM